MGFFNHLFSRGKAYEHSTPKWACELFIEGRRYMLDEFDVDFHSGGNRRYIPLYAVFSERLSPELESWISRSSQRKDGVVKFFRHTDRLEEGAVFVLSFYSAACLRYRKSTRDNRPQTTLVLAARRIKLDEQEFDMQ